jgi:predicted transposase/invertase (TIGR01784 family)
MAKRLIRFDWAMKKILRNKADFDILEGFLSELLGFDVRIENILESESNKDDELEKFNRVDILVKSLGGELMLVEVQNDPEVDYFQRMLFGVSKLVTQYIKEGEPYGAIKKIFAISIVYFDLGQGKDYVYEYCGEFVGMHYKDVLAPSALQRQSFKIEKVSDIYPKLYILKVNNFDKVAEDTLDEWIYFLKNSEVGEGFKAKGLAKAKERLAYEALSEEDKRRYNRFQENRRIERSVKLTRELEAKFQEEQIKQLKAEASELKAEASELKAEASELKAEASELKAEASELKAEASELKAEAKEKEARMEQLAKEAREKEAQLKREFEVQKAQEAEAVARRMLEAGLADELVAQVTNLSVDQVRNLRGQ